MIITRNKINGIEYILRGGSIENIEITTSHQVLAKACLSLSRPDWPNSRKVKKGIFFSFLEVPSVKSDFIISKILGYNKWVNEELKLHKSNEIYSAFIQDEQLRIETYGTVYSFLLSSESEITIKDSCRSTEPLLNIKNGSLSPYFEWLKTYGPD